MQKFKYKGQVVIASTMKQAISKIIAKSYKGLNVYTKNELLKELADGAGCGFKSYGTWKVASKIDGIVFSFTTNDEEWKTGIFDPKKYNSENPKSTDTACEDNYEPTQDLRKRMAEALLDRAIESNPNRFYVCENGKFVLLDEEQDEFVHDSDTYTSNLLYEGKYDEWVDAYDEWEQNK